MLDKVSLVILYSSKPKKILKDIPYNTKIEDVVKMALKLFDLPTNDISDQTYNILIGSKQLNSKENLEKTLSDKGIEDDENISIYKTTDIILGKFLIQYKESLEFILS